jgi:Spy/CpxP family protein refolding chaperone
MRKLIWVLGLAVAPALAAQDSAGPPDSVQRERLQEEIDRRFGQVVQQRLGLTGDQSARLRATEERFRARRRAILRQQLALRFALDGQMRPGQAADADSVRRLMDGIQANRAELFRLEQDQDREMAGYLTPVQRAQYQMLRERLLARLQEVRRERGLGRGQGVRPRDGPRPREGPRRRPRP